MLRHRSDHAVRPSSLRPTVHRIVTHEMGWRRVSHRLLKALLVAALLVGGLLPAPVRPALAGDPDAALPHQAPARPILARAQSLGLLRGPAPGSASRMQTR